MKHKQMIGIFAIIAVVLISLGFVIDSDEAYDSIWQTIFEFTWLTIFLFALQTGLYFLGFGVYKLMGKLSR